MDAVGLDGRRIPPEEMPADMAPDEPEAITDDIALFDRLPKWARDALRELPIASIKVREILPAIQSGQVRRDNIAYMLSLNDQAARAYYARKDREDGIA